MHAWGAFATKFDVVWPDPGMGHLHHRNGKGPTNRMLKQQWRKLDYNRIADESKESSPSPDLKVEPNDVFSRNGRGRHAAFRFSDPYRVAHGGTASRSPMWCAGADAAVGDFDRWRR